MKTIVIAICNQKGGNGTNQEVKAHPMWQDSPIGQLNASSNPF